MCRLAETLDRQGSAHFRGESARLECLQNRRVVRWVADECHAFVVFGGSPDQRNAANINVLNCFRQRNIRVGNGCFKGIQIDSHQVDVIPPMVCQVCLVGGSGARQQTTVNGRVERFHASPQHFRGTGVISHIADRDVAFPQHAGGSAGCEQVPAESGKPAGKFNQTGFIVNRENSFWHGGRTFPGYWFK